MSAHIIEALRPFEVPINSLTELPGNPRLGNVKVVAESLARFGQRKPIVVRKSDRAILAGNHTWRAAQYLEWESVAAVVVDVPLEEGLAFALADNRTSDLGAYDDRLLAALLQALSDPFSGTGYEQRDLDRLLGQLQESTPADIAEGQQSPETLCPKCGAVQ